MRQVTKENVNEARVIVGKKEKTRDNVGKNRVTTKQSTSTTKRSKRGRLDSEAHRLTK